MTMVRERSPQLPRLEPWLHPREPASVVPCLGFVANLGISISRRCAGGKAPEHSGSPVPHLFGAGFCQLLRRSLSAIRIDAFATGLLRGVPVNMGRLEIGELSYLEPKFVNGSHNSA